VPPQEKPEDLWAGLSEGERGELTVMGWTAELYNVGDGPETPWRALSEKQVCLALPATSAPVICTPSMDPPAHPRIARECRPRV
jgi:hypothetical protein